MKRNTRLTSTVKLKLEGHCHAYQTSKSQVSNLISDRSVMICGGRGLRVDVLMPARRW